MGVVIAVAFGMAGSAACRSRGGSGADADAAPDAGPLAASSDASAPIDPRREDLWARARAGEADDLARLADREGSLGLQERAKDPALLLTALRAVAYTKDLQALPWLAAAATDGTDEQATIALESAERIAATPRRSVDAEDAIEVRAGCDALLALAQSPETTHPKPRRALAVGVLRMLSDRGCAAESAIPKDLDLR
jgi:hypothetical protein